MNEETPKRRAECICIHEGKLLLIHRINKENIIKQEYFIFPGGLVDEDESIENALIQETEDETSVKVSLGELLHSEEENQDGEEENYYFCDYILGEPKLKEGSEEYDQHMKGRQLYTPMWVPLELIEDLIIYPETVKMLILEKIQGE